jgi:cytokinin riboside 5'-monophosphate phosphoribohydrolase
VNNNAVVKKENKMKRICVFCSSSDAVDVKYKNAAVEIGQNIVKNNYELVYGGAKVGLMGLVAKTVKKNGGKVIGIIPSAIKAVAYENCDELIFTSSLRDRKELMDKKSDAFISLPGGFGTLEEAMEFLTLKQLHFHERPMIFFNINGYYDHLKKLFEVFYKESFSKKESRALYEFSDNIQSIFKYLSTYTPPPEIKKWF